jgi:hypothetical protein
MEVFIMQIEHDKIKDHYISKGWIHHFEQWNNPALLCVRKSDNRYCYLLPIKETVTHLGGTELYDVLVTDDSVLTCKSI